MLTTNAPVALFLYRRPEKARRVADAISRANPTRVYLIADGAASSADERPVERTREVVTSFDWPCPVDTAFSASHLGIKERFASGLRWVFENESQAIILEDDTLPNQSFFEYADQLLDRYADNSKVFDITGFNYLDTWNVPSDYYFSFFGGIWGWASWRDSWESYDPHLSRWPDREFRRRIKEAVGDRKLWQYARRRYRKTYHGELDTWDYQWTAARHAAGALSAVPRHSLVENIGFGHGASNTNEMSHRLADIQSKPLSFPLEHPPSIQRDVEYDRAYYDVMHHRLDHPIFQSIYNIVRGLEWYGSS